MSAAGTGLVPAINLFIIKEPLVWRMSPPMVVTPATFNVEPDNSPVALVDAPCTVPVAVTLLP